jgi:two-component system nitrogen regulation response regulator NtrX
MMSGQATLSDAVQATREGAFHFLEKPLSPETVLVTLKGALEVSRARALSRSLAVELGPGAELVGSTPTIKRVRDLVKRVAPTDARVLITGESGTGKELVATAIHELSGRRGGPLIRVNSAAIPRDLVESEMFGHEKGAFTGATERRRGRFELAHGGTLFLDEVADLGAEAQAKLLRALESGEVERVGSSGPISVDVRVLAATNRDLREEVRNGRFREDLLFRLDVVPIWMPPLRERRRRYSRATWPPCCHDGSGRPRTPRPTRTTTPGGCGSAWTTMSGSSSGGPCAPPPGTWPRRAGGCRPIGPTSIAA